ncbi:hypothetical protein AB0L33_32260 [Streptomyces sp. NPDC052299]|uniref:hypothetical protein n=1 Tax=Streptomyces sp. NPDC052299 TaxID=3155054 RepID=UPI00344A66E1
MAQSEDEWPWLEDRPVFTTRGERGGNVTVVPAGVVLKPLTWRFRLYVLGLVVSVALVAVGVWLVVSGSRGASPGASWWWLALVLPAAGFALLWASGIYVEGMYRIMRERPRNLLLLAGLLGGCALGLTVPSALGRADGVRPVAALSAFFCAVTGFFAARGVRRARKDVLRILRLRSAGPAHPGVIAALPDPQAWSGGGDVPVRYRDNSTGGERTVTVRVNTWAHMIPVPGTRVIVHTDEDGDLLVELDPAHPVEYFPDSRRYDQDTSGGGSM